MIQLEKLAYELRPYAYAVIATYSIFNYQVSKLMFFSGLLLALCSYTVFMLRHKSRKALVTIRSGRKQ